jgi:hypothetical protein
MSKKPTGDELRDEYDFSPDELRAGIRGKYADRYAKGVNIVRLEADVAEVFPDSESVNEALRPLADMIRKRAGRPD